jgi:hypothetical protein
MVKKRNKAEIIKTLNVGLFLRTLKEAMKDSEDEFSDFRKVSPTNIQIRMPEINALIPQK